MKSSLFRVLFPSVGLKSFEKRKEQPLVRLWHWIKTELQRIHEIQWTAASYI